MSKEKDLAVLTTDVAYTTPEKKAAFHRVAKQYLRRLAAAMSLPPESYEIRSNKAGIAVSGEVTLHGERIYVQVSQLCVGPRERVVMYRGCRGRKDYCGLQNNFADASALVETDGLAALCLIEAEKAMAVAGDRAAA